MTLSSLAVKALIGFSLGLNANTSPNQVLGDSAKTKKTNCEIKTTKTGNVKSQPNSKKQVANGSAKSQKEPDSCGKCGKG
ncbi:MAG: hypothetical protein JNJ40_17180 [Bacteroidia bacterium]|nr:hypothetical protein [Bacteroidia bacterium]